MENLLTTIVFILPGFMLYFWIQMMGITPVNKHTAFEFAALAALAWFPVIMGTLFIINLFGIKITTLSELSKVSDNLTFLLIFVGISVVVSFVMAIFYIMFVYKLQNYFVNTVRECSGKAALSNSTTVWEEVFHQDDIQVIGISKTGSAEPDYIGSIAKAARPFELKRSLKIEYSEYCKKIVNEFKVPIKDVYIDVDAGINICIYDIEKYNEADNLYREMIEGDSEEDMD